MRNASKGEHAAAGIVGHTEVRQLDVSSLASLRAFADSWTGDLDVLVNNAGIMQVPESHTADGFELQAATQDVPGGSYVGPDGLASIKGYPKIGKPSRADRDAETDRQLWDVSSRLTGAGSAPLSANTASPRTGRSR